MTARVARIYSLGMATETIDELVGERVHRFAWRARIKQAQLATEMGLSQQSVSRKMRGQQPWTVEELYRAADVLGCEPSELLPHLDSNQKPFGYGYPLVETAA